MHTGYDDLVWVPSGHNDGYAYATVVLGRDDTAWNPSSTKHVIYGPAKVTYERSPASIVGYVE
jgi:hypothetical protein